MLIGTSTMLEKNELSGYMNFVYTATVKNKSYILYKTFIKICVF